MLAKQSCNLCYYKKFSWTKIMRKKNYTSLLSTNEPNFFTIIRLYIKMNLRE